MVNKLDVEIPNSIEGPILQREIEMSLSEWKDKLNPNTTDDRSIPLDRNIDNKLNPFRQRIVDLIQEQQGEKSKDDPILKVLTDPNNSDYVFRCFSRSPEATDYRNSGDPSGNLLEHGYDKTPGEDDKFWYSINHAWFNKLWPLYDNGATAYMAIYKNDPTVFNQESKAIELRDHVIDTPSLRDLLIGVVKINWQ